MSLSKGPEIANTREGQLEKQTNSAPPANPHYNGTVISKAKLQILCRFSSEQLGGPADNTCHYLPNHEFSWSH